MKLLGLRADIEINDLLSSTTYKTDRFDHCIYCHNEIENDYYDYKGEWYQPYRCKCENAIKELEIKETMLEEVLKLREGVDFKRINDETKQGRIKKIEKMYKQIEER